MDSREGRGAGHVAWGSITPLQHCSLLLSPSQEKLPAKVNLWHVSHVSDKNDAVLNMFGRHQVPCAVFLSEELHKGMLASLRPVRW